MLCYNSRAVSVLTHGSEQSEPNVKTIMKSTLRAAVHGALGPMEANLLARYPAPRKPVVFIVGPPRSGTSLFYELLVTHYHLAFFSNLAHRFWRTPAAVTQLGAGIIRNRRPLFQSAYGHIPGWSAPNEGGWIWRRWLKDGDWMDERAASGLPLAEMRATIGAIEAVMGAPFVNKNVMHANRIRLLNLAFPGCLFLEVWRDPVETARSIIRAERKEKGPQKHPDNWWSVRPSTARPGDVVERAAVQVTGVIADIARDSRYLNRDCLHRVDYARLCAAPAEVMAEVASFLNGRGLVLQTRAEIPARFDLALSRPLEPTEEERLRILIDAG